MENNENLVLGTENVEVTTEETPVVEERTYKQSEVDSIVGKAKGRAKAQAKKEYDRTYGSLVDVLKAGTGKESVEELTETFANFYKSKGVNIPQKPTYSDKDIEVLARVDAEEFIASGIEDVTEEANRLADIGAERMTPREKALFVKLNDYINDTETGRQLEKIGVKEDVYRSDDFKSFARKFDSKTPITEIYDIYQKTQPKKEFKTMGSIKHTASDSGAVKEFYSVEEARKFSQDDLNKNPALYEAIKRSMLKW